MICTTCMKWWAEYLVKQTIANITESVECLLRIEKRTGRLHSVYLIEIIWSKYIFLYFLDFFLQKSIFYHFDPIYFYQLSIIGFDWLMSAWSWTCGLYKTERLHGAWRSVIAQSLPIMIPTYHCGYFVLSTSIKHTILLYHYLHYISKPGSHSKDDYLNIVWL